MFQEEIDIDFIYSKNEILLRWIKHFPKSKRDKVKNILSIDSDNSNIDKKVIEYFPNCEKYYITQSDYDNYQNCINNLYGNFQFKISYSDIFDYELDPYISYDLIIFFTNFNLDESINTFIKRTFDLVNDNGQIMIITCRNDKFVKEAREFFNVNFISDLEFKDKIDINCKLFNTHVSTYLNLNKLTKKEILRITNHECSDQKLEEFKKIAIDKYGDIICVPISIIILSKYKFLHKN